MSLSGLYPISNACISSFARVVIFTSNLIIFRLVRKGWVFSNKTTLMSNSAMYGASFVSFFVIVTIIEDESRVCYRIRVQSPLGYFPSLETLNLLPFPFIFPWLSTAWEFAASEDCGRVERTYDAKRTLENREQMKKREWKVNWADIRFQACLRKLGRVRHNIRDRAREGCC